MAHDLWKHYDNEATHHNKHIDPQFILNDLLQVPDSVESSNTIVHDVEWYAGEIQEFLKILGTLKIKKNKIQ